MTEQITQQLPVEHKKGLPPKFKNALDRISRRERRNSSKVVYNNDRTPKNQGFLNMGNRHNWASIFWPKRKKFKGYMRKMLILIILFCCVDTAIIARPFFVKTKHTTIKRMTQRQVNEARVGRFLYERYDGKLQKNLRTPWGTFRKTTSYNPLKKHKI
jgi:hypothetical protein